MRRSSLPSPGLIAVIAGVFVLASAAFALAQFRGRGVDGAYAPARFPDGDFVICRLVYTEVRR